MITKRIYCGLLLTAVMFISTALPQAQAVAVEQQGQPKAIVGSWIETITVSGPGAPPPFKSVGVYNEDGNMVFSDQGSVTTSPPLSYGAGVGSWTYVKERTFAWTGVELISDLSGSLVGIFKVRGETTLDQSGNKYTSKWHAEIFDPSGGLLFSADGTNEGQRVVVEPLP